MPKPAPDHLSDQVQRSLGSAYTVIRELGGGGMSRVFLATESALARQVVIKVVPPETAASVSIERFKREIQLAARLQHPHIVPLLSAGEIEGLPYFTMPFVEGESLRVRLARRGELPVAEAVRVLREIASALAYAHERGVVHRDIKPDNVLLSGGAAMVTDFGVAKALSTSSNADHDGMTSLGVALGTPAYMSPEQASADPTVDHRADVYAFGILAYELLTGQTPFGGRTPQGLLAAHVTEPPEAIQKRRSSLPPALAALVMRCLEKRPADRPQSATEIVHALDDLSTPSGGMAPTSAVAAATPVVTPTPVTSGGRRGVVIAAAAIALMVMGMAGYRLFVSRGASADSAGSASPSGASVQSLAVLPLENGARDSADAYLADGISEDLIAELSKVPQLTVVSRRSSFAFRGKTASSADIGKALGVASLLEGTVRRDGRRLHVTAQLTRAKDGVVQWSERFDQDAHDVFAVQNSITRAIVAALRLSLGGAATGGAVSPARAEAHDLVLRGRYQAQRFTKTDLQAAIASYKRALAVDSTYAPAWVGIARAYADLADDWLAPSEAYAAGESALQKALLLDPNLSDVHAELAGLDVYYLHDFASGIREADRALALNPNETAALRMKGLALSFIGRPDDAVSTLQKARTLDPLASNIAGDVARVLVYAGRYDEAVAAARQAMAIDPQYALAHFFAGQALLEKGDARGSIAEFELASGTRDRRIAGLASAHAALGDTAQARRELNEMLAESKRRYVRPEFVAWAYLAVGDRNAALTWLEKAYEVRSGGIGYVPVDPRWLSLRSEPRFQALRRKILGR